MAALTGEENAFCAGVFAVEEQQRRGAWYLPEKVSVKAGPFSSGETVCIVVELYRHTPGWKVRAVGQGYDTGLAGLACDYGIDVEA